MVVFEGKMNTDKLNQWLTLAANVGVILGIAFLVIEVRQANIIAEGEARDRNAVIIFEIAQAIAESEGLLEVSVKLRDPNPELSPVEDELARQLAAMYISKWGKLVIQNSTGLLPDSSLRFGQNGIAATFDEYPGLAPYVAKFLDYRHTSRLSTHPVWGKVWEEVLEHGGPDRLPE